MECKDIFTLWHLKCMPFNAVPVCVGIPFRMRVAEGLHALQNGYLGAPTFKGMRWELGLIARLLGRKEGDFS